MANLPHLGLFQLSPLAPKAHPLPRVLPPWPRGSSSRRGRAGQRCRQQSETRRDARPGKLPGLPVQAEGQDEQVWWLAGKRKRERLPLVHHKPQPPPLHPRSGAAAGAGVTRPGGCGAPRRPERGAGGAGLSLPALHQEQTPTGRAVVENQELQAILNELSK